MRKNSNRRRKGNGIGHKNRSYTRKKRTSAPTARKNKNRTSQ